MSWLVRLIPAAIAMAGTLHAQETILTINAENFVYYEEDTPDPSLFASTTGPVTPKPVRNFSRGIFICDITSVNGVSAKGTVLAQVRSTALRPSPTGVCARRSPRCPVNSIRLH
jgi:hypothetical protein